jgi:hypothetical protein
MMKGGSGSPRIVPVGQRSRCPPSVAMVRDRRADEARLPVPRGNAVAHARVDVGASVLILL